MTDIHDMQGDAEDRSTLYNNPTRVKLAKILDYRGGG